MQQSKSQLSLTPSSVAQSVSAYSTDQLASHAYWLFNKEVEHFSLDSLEERGRKREILWTGEAWSTCSHIDFLHSKDAKSMRFEGKFTESIHFAGIRGPIDAANAKAIRCEDPILLCSTGADAVITGILEATCKGSYFTTLTPCSCSHSWSCKHAPMPSCCT